MSPELKSLFVGKIPNIASKRMMEIDFLSAKEQKTLWLITLACFVNLIKDEARLSESMPYIKTLESQAIS